MTLRMATSDVVLFGTSMPMIGLPGTGASIRMVGAARASARSLARLVTLFTRTRVRDTTSVRTTGRPLASYTGRPRSSFTGTVRVFVSQPGSTPNWVTVGPWLMETTRASTPKEARVSTIRRARASLSTGRTSTSAASASRSYGGSSQPRPAGRPMGSSRW